jgi:hypothetical protein
VSRQVTRTRLLADDPRKDGPQSPSLIWHPRNWEYTVPVYNKLTYTSCFEPQNTGEQVPKFSYPLRSKSVSGTGTYLLRIQLLILPIFHIYFDLNLQKIPLPFWQLLVSWWVPQWYKHLWASTRLCRLDPGDLRGQPDWREGRTCPFAQPELGPGATHVYHQWIPTS